MCSSRDCALSYRVSVHLHVAPTRPTRRTQVYCTPTRSISARPSCQVSYIDSFSRKLSRPGRQAPCGNECAPEEHPLRHLAIGSSHPVAGRRKEEAQPTNLTSHATERSRRELILQYSNNLCRACDKVRNETDVKSREDGRRIGCVVRTPWRHDRVRASHSCAAGRVTSCALLVSIDA